MEALKCPNCNANLTNEIEGGKTTCAFCGSIIIINNGSKDVKDIHTGLVIGEASSPKSFTLGGALNESLQSSAYPLTTLIWCMNKDNSVRFFVESGKCFEQILSHITLRHQEDMMDQNYLMPMVSFKTIEEYLDISANDFTGGKPKTLEKETYILPVPFVDDSIPRVIGVIQDIQAHRLSSDISEKYAKCLTRIYKIDDGYLLLSAALFGLKWYVNGPMVPNFGNIFNLFKNNQSNEVNNKESLSMQTPVPGKPATFIHWWVPNVYGLFSKNKPDEKLLKEFSMFASSVKESNAILERRYQMSNQLINNMYLALQQEFAYADNFVANAQADIRRRQTQISNSISQRNDIIMSTYENRVASQDRMRKNTSEAIRGVDTYATSSGVTEFKTGAKRVIEKNNDTKNKVEIGYLDTVPDGWTEIFKV